MASSNSLPIMIVYAVALHLVFGMLGLVDYTAYLSTAPAALFRLFGTYTAFVCFLVAIMAIAGLFVRTNRPLAALIYMLPQQGLLVISAVGAAHAIYTGQFADGVERSRYFIAGDQAPAILAAIGHTASMLRYVLRERWL